MTQPDDDRVRAWRAIMHAHSRIVGELDRVLQKELGIPGAWYEALVEIAFAGGTMTMNEFAAETTLTKSGATRFADRLVEAGLVERRQSSSDRRSWQLALTPLGKQTQRRAAPHVLAVIKRSFGDHLSDDEARIILDALTRVNHPEPVAPV